MTEVEVAIPLRDYQRGTGEILGWIRERRQKGDVIVRNQSTAHIIDPEPAVLATYSFRDAKLAFYFKLRFGGTVA